MHLVFTILICIIKLTEKSSRELWKTIVPLMFFLQNYKLGTKEFSEWKHVQRVRKIPSPEYIYIYIYIYYGEVYQDVNESFCIIRSSFFDVSIHSLLTKMACWCNSILPWSTDSFETHLSGFYFSVTLWAANNTSLF